MVFAVFGSIIALISFLIATHNARFYKWQRRLFFVAFIVFIALCISLIQPKGTFDLTRHYRLLDGIKSSNQNWIKYIVDNGEANYRFTYFFNFLTYFIGKYLLHQALPFLAAIICYGVVEYLLNNAYENKKFKNGHIALTVFVTIGFLPVVYVYSGIRNAVAAAIVALAIYLRIYKDISLTAFFALSALAATMHPVAIAAVPFMFLSKIHPGKKSVILILLIPYLLDVMMTYFRKSNYDILRYIGAKFYSYISRVHYQGKTFYYSAIIMTATVLLFSLIRRKEASNKDRAFINFITWYCIFVFANLRSYQIVSRLPYVLGILSPQIVQTIFSPSYYHGWKRTLLYSAFAGIAAVAIFDIYQNFMWMC